MDAFGDVSILQAAVEELCSITCKLGSLPFDILQELWNLVLGALVKWVHL
jgi:hypothetical protein